MRGWGLLALWQDVREFHLGANHRAPDAPGPQTPEWATKRSRWIESECQELRDAVLHTDEGPEGTVEGDIVGQADAYIDIIYFAVGGLVELGLSPQALWDIVQEANMRKRWPDGTFHLNAEGRVQKPPGWQPPEPELAAEVERQCRS